MDDTTDTTEKTGPSRRGMLYKRDDHSKAISAANFRQILCPFEGHFDSEFETDWSLFEGHFGEEFETDLELI